MKKQEVRKCTKKLHGVTKGCLRDRGGVFGRAEDEGEREHKGGEGFVRDQ